MKRKKYRKHHNYQMPKNDFEPSELFSPETKKSVFIVILLAISFISLLSLLNLAGNLGELLKGTLGTLFGWGLVLFPAILLILSLKLLRPEKYSVKPSNYLGLFILILSYSGLFQFIKDFNSPTILESGSGGGTVGYFIYLPLQNIMGAFAALLVLLALFSISLLITFNTSLQIICQKINPASWFKGKISSAKEENDEDWESDEDLDRYAESVEIKSSQNTNEEADNADNKAENENGEFSQKKIPVHFGEKKQTAMPEGLKVIFSKAKYKRVEVPLNLLDGQTGKPTPGDIQRNSEIIKATLANFGIEVDMDEVNIGPTVTQFTFKPRQGVKLAQITALQNDLALALAAHPIRLEAPIPGKSLVGLEVPNQSIAIVKLKNIIASKEFQKKRGNLKIGLGQDVTGRPWAIDIAGMPHLLIAGATGSGKSVCINSIIVSLLYQHSPDTLRLIAVDPKRVELTNYNGIPHLLTPVITEIDKTVNALRWLVKEMDQRFKLLYSVNKRNIEAYNESALINRLPYIILIIDELADLMAVAARDVEGIIVRLAQMSRAVGIHLILATQRPSVNVITGLIKANVPSRIAFAVASQVDSRTILDSSGAEKLLGKGDMLFTSAELGKPRRLQGAFLSDLEIERVISFWKEQTEPDYNDDVVESHGSSYRNGSFGNSDAGDELYNEAKDIIIRAGKASASLLQRRLRVGYARAARLLDLLEEQGIIGPGEGAKPREVIAGNEDIFGIPSETTEHYNANEDDATNQVSDYTEEENINEANNENDGEEKIPIHKS